MSDYDTSVGGYDLTSQPTAVSAQQPSVNNAFTHNSEVGGRESHDRQTTGVPTLTLDELIPANATSVEKKRLIAE